MIPRHLLAATALLFALAIAMGIYVAQLRHRDITPPLSREEQHVSPPASGPTERVTVWVAHDDNGTLSAQSIVVASVSETQQRAEELLRGLLDIYVSKDSPHRLGPGAEIHDIYLVDPGLVVIDLNAAFADEQTSGVLAEELTIVSMIQTLTTNIPGLTRVKFLVDGKDRDTLAGHADLSSFYDASQVSQLAKQLTTQ
jgi:spore germination protein GerM